MTNNNNKPGIVPLPHGVPEINAAFDWLHSKSEHGISTEEVFESIKLLAGLCLLYGANAVKDAINHPKFEEWLDTCDDDITVQILRLMLQNADAVHVEKQLNNIICVEHDERGN